MAVRLIKNAVFYISSLGIQKVLVMAYFWYYSNRISVEDLGTLVFVLGFTAFFAILVDLGLVSVLTRESAKDPKKGEQYLRVILGFKVFSGLLTIAVIYIVHLVSPKAPFVFLAISTGIMLLDSFKQSLYSFVRGQRDFRFESLTVLLYQITTIAFGVTALQITDDITYLFVALFIASVLDVAYVLFILKLKFKIRICPQFNIVQTIMVLRMTPAFTLSGIFNKAYVTIDVILLRYLANERALGFFAVPAKIINTLQNMGPIAFSSVLFPTMSNYSVNDKKKLSKVLHKSFFYLLFIAAPMAFGLYLLAHELTYLFWGDKYIQSIPVLKLMAFSIPFLFCSFPFGAFLNASHNEKFATITRGVVILVNIILDIILIPIYGFYGAGIAWFATSIILFGMDLFWVSRKMEISWRYIIKSVIKVVFITILMVIFIYFLKVRLSVWLVVSFAGLFYIGVAFLFKIVSLKELKSLRHL